MTTLKLTMRLSYVDDQKAYFVFVDDNDTSKAKLARACTGAKPYNSEGFSLTCNNVDEFIGRDCTLYVKVIPYSFKSKYDKNRGELVQGHRLKLIDIRIDEI